MNRAEFDAFCGSLPATTHVVQWGGASVWKVGGKIFAVCTGWGKDGQLAADTGKPAKDRIGFKCSDLSYDILRQQPGIIPSPYLARAKWVQVRTEDALNDDELKAYIEQAHSIIARKLTRATRKKLDLGR
ncbi:MAG: MmcQ/YjbR family DNA-binding protein [Alphaproteobacteria bacterium]